MIIIIYNIFSIKEGHIAELLASQTLMPTGPEYNNNIFEIFLQ